MAPKKRGARPANLENLQPLTGFKAEESEPAAAETALVTPQKRRRVCNDNLGDIVTEDREAFMLAEISQELKGDKELIADIWHIVKQKKLKKKGKGREKSLDLPTSCNKFEIVSKDRLELALLHCSPGLDANALKDMPKQALCRLLTFGVHAEEGSAVPSKIWTEFLAACKKLHEHYGLRLDQMLFKEVIGDIVLIEPDYAKFGTFMLLASDYGDKFDRVQHWTGIIAPLEEELDLTYVIESNYKETLATIRSPVRRSRSYEVKEIFEISGKWKELPSRMMLATVGDPVLVHTWRPALTDADREETLALEDGPGTEGASQAGNGEEENDDSDDVPAGLGSST